MKVDTCCTLAPYFEVPADKMPEFKLRVEEFLEKTRNEQACMFYAFSFSGQIAHCREGYDDAAGLLVHLDNIGTVFQQALKISKLIRLEVHGPAAELDKLRAPLADLNPQWFTLAEGGIRR